jgi:hypothetical protein
MGCAVLCGCGDDESAGRPDREYFPLQTGFYQIYTVEENTYSEVNPPELRSYELKTEVMDSFPNQEGGITFVIHRSKRNTTSDAWEFQEAWSARVTSYQAVLSEGNVAYVLLAFPTAKNKKWNGNSLNSLEADDYKMESVGGSYSLETDLSFNDVLIINQEDRVNELTRDDREEIYARNVGLIYKRSVVLNYCDDAGCFGQEIIKDGVEYWQVLKEYGQN